MRMHGHLRSAKDEAAIVRSSLGLRCLFAAVRSRFTHHRAMFVEGDPGRLKHHPPRTHQPFDEQRSIIDFLRTEPQRIGIGDLTNCGRFAPSLCAGSSENRCQCMRMDRCRYQTAPGSGGIKQFALFGNAYFAAAELP